MLYHTSVLVNPSTDKLTAVRGFGWLNSFARGGFLGVDVFFVLSGFLIVLLVAHFVYSCFATNPAVSAIPASRAIPLRQELNSIAVALAYVFNYVVSLHPNSVAFSDLGHLWSLSVEEQFYLLWPALLALVIRWRADMVPRVIGLGIAVVMADRLLLFPDPHVDLYVRTDARADSLLIGALLAWLWAHGRFPKLPRAAPWCATGVIVFFIATSRILSASLYNGGFTPNVAARVAFGYALSALATYLSWMLVEKRALSRR